MPPLEPKLPDQETQSLADQIQSAVAPLDQGIQDNGRLLAQALALIQEMRASMAAQDDRIKQMVDRQASQDAALAKISTDIQVAMNVILLNIEKTGRLG